MKDCKCGRCEWCTLTNPVECKGCGDVVSAKNLKDGYCDDCVKERNKEIDYCGHCDW